MNRRALRGFLFATVALSVLLSQTIICYAGPIDLDLSSTNRTVSASPSVPSGTVTITVGGQARVISAADSLTPAEFLAVQQMINTGSQSIQLGLTGNATGGTFTATIIDSLRNLVIPQAVELAQNIGTKQLSLTGNLTNGGTISPFSNSSSIATAIISAQNIFNQAGAVISTLNGFGEFSGLNLTLNAAQSLVNDGLIRTGGQLSVNSPTITNTGTMRGNSIVISTNNLANNGLITATTGGEVSFLGPVTIQALTGNLNITGSGMLEGSLITLLAQNGSVNAAQGAISGMLTGQALNNFSVSVDDGEFDVTDITTQNGDVSLTGADSLIVFDGSTISAGGNINLHADSELQIGAVAIEGSVNGVSLIAGTKKNGGIKGTGLEVETGDFVSMSSSGGSIELAADESVYMGFQNSIFADGGNVIFQAAQYLDLGNSTTITTQSRNLGSTVTIDGVRMFDYRGGGLVLSAGKGLQNQEDVIRGLVLGRTIAGSVEDDGNSDFFGTTFNLGHGHNLKVVDPSGRIAIQNSTFNVTGGVVSIDPELGSEGSVLIGDGAVFNVLGPDIIPAPIIVVGGTTIFDTGSGTATTPPSDQPKTDTPITSNLPPTDLTRSRGFGISTYILDNSVRNMNIGIAEPTDTKATVFVSSQCQPFLYKYADAILFGCGGTQFSPSSGNAMNLGEGRVVAITSGRPLVVQTEKGAVNIERNSAALIEQAETGGVRVVSLSGGAVRMIPRNAEERTLAVKPGEELVVQSDEDREELIATDGVERNPIGGAIHIAGLSVKTNSFDRKEFAEKEALLNCINKKNTWQNVRDKVQQLHDDMWQPVSYGLRAKTTPEEAQTYSDAMMSIKHSGNAQFEINKNGEIDLQRGEIVLSPKKAGRVNVGTSSVFVSSNAIALVDQRQSTTIVRSLAENRGGSIAVLCGDRFVHVPAGHEVVMGGKNSEITAMLKSDSIARRRVRIYTMPENQSAARSEVSFVSIAKDSPILRTLLRSPSVEDRNIMKRAIKTAASVAYATAGHGQYSVVPPPND